MRAAPAPGRLERLTKGYQYRQVCKKGRLAKGELLWLFLLPSPGRGIRLGVSISAGIVKKASARNKLRRVIREWFRTNSCAVKGGYEAVVVAKKEIPLTLTRRGLKLVRKELIYLLGRLEACYGEKPSADPLIENEKTDYNAD